MVTFEVRLLRFRIARDGAAGENITGEGVAEMGPEEKIRERHQANDIRGASDLIARAYGKEIMGFLRRRFFNEADAEDVFQTCFKDVLEGLAGFRGEAQYRSWIFKLARHAAARKYRGDGRYDKRFVRGATTAAQRVAWAARSSTAAYRRTDAKNALMEARATLSSEDQDLIALRECGHSWGEIARLWSDRELADEAALEREGARLKKRYSRIKESLAKKTRARVT
jgi:RNA polymerase sigma-70 factor, ECF subfamily